MIPNHLTPTEQLQYAMRRHNDLIALQTECLGKTKEQSAMLMIPFIKKWGNNA